MKITLIATLLILVILISGCTQSTTGSNKGLTISLKASPNEVFTGSSTSLQIDVENLGDRTFHDVRVFLYDIGTMKWPYKSEFDLPKQDIAPRGDNDYCETKIANGYGPCTEGEGDCDTGECAAGLECRTVGSSLWEQLKNYLTRADICCSPGAPDDYCTELYELWAISEPKEADMTITEQGYSSCAYGNELVRPGEFDSFMCSLHAPSQILGGEEITYVRTKANFITEFSLPVIASIINEDEYHRRKTTGNLPSSPRSFSADDGNVQIDVKFSKDMPIVDRYGEDEYMYITVTNIGQGYLDEIRPQDIRIWDTTSEASEGTTEKPVQEEEEDSSIWDMIFGRSGRVTGGAISDFVENVLNDVGLDTGIGHGESGCMFDFQCSGDLLCKSATYLTPGKSACCNPNENVFMEFDEPVCKTLAEENPYVVDLATQIIQPGRCDIEQGMSPLRPLANGKTFPRITCRLQLPADVPFITNHVIIVTIGYDYELRQETSVRILK